MSTAEERLERSLRKVAAFNAAMRVMTQGARATEATAGNGAVTVQIDARGAATAVLLDDGWRGRVSGPLGEAVVRAYQDARQQQVIGGLDAIAQLPDRLDDVPVTEDDLAAARPAPVDLDELRRTLPPINEVNAMLQSALDDVQRMGQDGPPVAPEPPTVADPDADVQLVLNASGGIVSCTVSEAWQRSAPLDSLLEALNQPLRDREETR